jgi:acetylornithine deacetylase/succinyl-diaminopimelate desuccinylase-like protein
VPQQDPAVTAFQDTLNIPIALMGFGLPSDRIHAPNERFHLPNFQKGITTSILFMHEVACVGRSRI